MSDIEAISANLLENFFACVGDPDNRETGAQADRVLADLDGRLRTAEEAAYQAST